MAKPKTPPPRRPQPKKPLMAAAADAAAPPDPAAAEPADPTLTPEEGGSAPEPGQPPNPPQGGNIPTAGGGGGLMASAQAQGGGGNFTPPPNTAIEKGLTPEEVDAVHRIVAAGMKLAYGPQMRQHLQEFVQSQDPVAKKLATTTTGLTLTLDQMSKGGIPIKALFPAAVELMVEAAGVLVQAGQTVTDDDFKEATRTLYVMIGKKLGASDAQLMQGAQQAIGGGAQQPPDQGAPPVAPGAPPTQPGSSATVPPAPAGV